MKVYVASAYRIGDQVANVRASIDAGERLLNAGHQPYLPLLNFTWHFIFPHDPNTWLDLDMSWLAKCDAVVRLPGRSDGADTEVAYARGLGLPVFFSVDECLLAYGGTPGPSLQTLGDVHQALSNRGLVQSHGCGGLSDTQSATVGFPYGFGF